MRAEGPLQDISFLTLHRARVATPCGDLRTTTINPKGEYSDGIWCMGIVTKLPFDPYEWIWNKAGPIEEQAFFNYLARKEYRTGLLIKPQKGRLLFKQAELNSLGEKSGHKKAV